MDDSSNFTADNQTEISTEPENQVLSEEPCPIFPLLQKFHEYYGTYLHGYLSLAICIFGVLANVANIVVLTRRQMQTSATNIILSKIAIANLLTVIVCIPVYIHFYLQKLATYPPPATRSFVWIMLLWIQISTAIICHTASVWLTIQLALFRYMIISLPLHVPKIFTPRLAAKVAYGIFVFSVVLIVPNIFCYCIAEKSTDETINATLSDFTNDTEINTDFTNDTEINNITAENDFSITHNVLEVHVKTNGTFEIDNYYTVEESIILQNFPLLGNINYWIQAIFIRILPSILLTTLTILLVWEMQKASKRRMKLKSAGKRDSSHRGRH